MTRPGGSVRARSGGGSGWCGSIQASIGGRSAADLLPADLLDRTDRDAPADGVAFLFNVPGAVTVTATKAGMTFRAHLVTARADKFTTTTVAP